MTSPIARIRPDRPVCWENENTLRVGFERADARIVSPSAGVQRLIGALRTGVAVDRMAATARRLGATPQEARELLTALAPVLATGGTAGRGATEARKSPLPGSASLVPTTPIRVQLSDDDRPVSGLREALLSTQMFVLETASTRTTAPDLILHIERFLEPLERAQRWVSTGQPHLLIAFTDRCIRVGPLVVGDGAPCHTCASLGALALDPALPIVAAQLASTDAPTESVAGVHLVATWASVIIGNWLAGDPAVHRMRTCFPMTEGRVDGVVQTESVNPHPECACAATNSQSLLPQ